MSDVVKWGLLAAGAVILIGLITALPFVDFMSFRQFQNIINNILSIVGTFFQNGRALVNCFLTPWGRTCLSGLLVWLFGKWLMLTAIKTMTWIYHFVFRG